MSDTPKWYVGQECAINCSRIVTVEKVTPTGKPRADGTLWDVRGYRSAGRFRSDRLEPLTDEIRADMEFKQRAVAVRNDLDDALTKADRWVRDAIRTWGGVSAEPEDVERAERLLAAIRAVLKDDAP